MLTQGVTICHLNVFAPVLSFLCLDTLTTTLLSFAAHIFTQRRFSLTIIYAWWSTFLPWHGPSFPKDKSYPPPISQRDSVTFVTWFFGSARWPKAPKIWLSKNSSLGCLFVTRLSELSRLSNHELLQGLIFLVSCRSRVCPSPSCRVDPCRPLDSLT